MTKEELKDFCLENAGKLASGKYGDAGRVVQGRIIAYMMTSTHGLILLEDAKSKFNTKLPEPLPTVPYQDTGKGWHRLVSPAKLGFPCVADTIVVVEEVSDQKVEAVANPSVQAPKVSRVCIHNVCDDTWCHLKYSGVI